MHQDDGCSSLFPYTVAVKHMPSIIGGIGVQTHYKDNGGSSTLWTDSHCPAQMLSAIFVFAQKLP